MVISKIGRVIKIYIYIYRYKEKSEKKLEERERKREKSEISQYRERKGHLQKYSQTSTIGAISLFPLSPLTQHNDTAVCRYANDYG